jgi:hypothetical protein
MAGSGECVRSLWEILVPCVRNDGRPIRARYHRVWDKTVRAISGGLTIMPPSRGQWLSPDGELFNERMIPVRFVATEEEADKIAAMTVGYYEQQSVMYYKVSSDVRFKTAENL